MPFHYRIPSTREELFLPMIPEAGESIGRYSIVDDYISRCTKVNTLRIFVENCNGLQKPITHVPYHHIKI